jgi:hypothetical protein
MAYIELVGRPVVTEDLDEDYANAQAMPAEDVAEETAPEAVEETVASAEDTVADAEEPKAEDVKTEDDKTEEDKKDG